MDHPAGYQFRAPTADDLGAVADVLIASELDDAGQVVLGEDFLRAEWSRVGFDLGTDAWLATDGTGEILGYGQARPDQPDTVDSWGVVHPEHRAQGIGSALLDRIEGRAAHLLAGRPSARFRHAIDAGDRAVAEMLRARGLRPVRHFWHMQIDLEGPVEPVRAPDGIEVTAIEVPDDLPAVHGVLDEAFADHWDHRPEPFDRWAERKTTNPSYDPALWLLVRKDGEPVGALTASVGDDSGWVDDLGVRAPYRGRGIGMALLRHAFAAIAGRGVRRVTLNVDAENPTGATAVYERAGMRVVKRWDLWERSSAPTA